MRNKPWLIDRGTFDISPRSHRPTIIYDYMGSTEFELGGQSDSLRRMFDEGMVTTVVKIRAQNWQEFAVSLVHRASFDVSSYSPFIQQLADGSLQLKEPSRFDLAVKRKAGIKSHFDKLSVPDVWHDFENDVIFSFDQQKLEETLKALQITYAEMDAAHND